MQPEPQHRLRELARGARVLGAQLPRLPGVRHRSLHLFGKGAAGRASPSSTSAASRAASGSRSGCARCCAEMSLEAFVKTSGKTGLHVFVPIERTVTFDAARQICETIGRHLHARAPEGDHDGVGGAEADRKDLHRLQHERARQDPECGLFAARACPGAPVSMPLTWEELEAAEPHGLHNRQCDPARLEKTRGPVA